MSPLGQILLAVGGFALLAASLAVKKKAGWLALAGAAALCFLAARESDPTLALGALALVAARFVRPPQRKPPAPGPRDRIRKPGPPAARGKRP